MSLRYAYNTNGLTSHRLDDALALLADCGYDGVAVTLDVAHHDPFAPDLAGRSRALRRRLDGLGLGSVVETGARFLLDPRRKHHPTLVSPDPPIGAAASHSCAPASTSPRTSAARPSRSGQGCQATTGLPVGNVSSTASAGSSPTPPNAV
jgi:hypothetical protein